MEDSKREPAGILYGVGTGPGDPELLTLKAVRILREADVIGIPSTKKEGCKAWQIAVQAVPEIEKKETLFVSFPMSRPCCRHPPLSAHSHTPLFPIL